jgi:hypothetical protein
MATRGSLHQFEERHVDGTIMRPVLKVKREETKVIIKIIMLKMLNTYFKVIMWVVMQKEP